MARGGLSDGRAEAHGLGLKVIPWTVNEPADIDAVLALGVDGIISDRPDVVLAKFTPAD